VGFLDGVLGRRKPARPDLDTLFQVPTAALTLQAALDLVPTGRGAVAFRAPEGRAFADLAAEVRALLDAGGGPPVEVTSDGFGYTWLVVASSPPDVGQVVTELHAVNSSLEAAGFGPQLLCSLVSFRDPGERPVALVYLYKQGSFYPFAPDPADPQRRDNVLELQVRDTVGSDLRVEPDLTRWFALWGAPGL
jgi:hypothetical protein